MNESIFYAKLKACSMHETRAYSMRIENIFYARDEHFLCKIKSMFYARNINDVRHACNISVYESAHSMQ